jgi:hypothetical protein
VEEIMIETIIPDPKLMNEASFDSDYLPDPPTPTRRA